MNVSIRLVAVFLSVGGTAKHVATEKTYIDMLVYLFHRFGQIDDLAGYEYATHPADMEDVADGYDITPNPFARSTPQIDSELLRKLWILLNELFEQIKPTKSYLPPIIQGLKFPDGNLPQRRDEWYAEADKRMQGAIDGWIKQLEQLRLTQRFENIVIEEQLLIKVFAEEAIEVDRIQRGYISHNEIPKLFDRLNVYYVDANEAADRLKAVDTAVRRNISAVWPYEVLMRYACVTNHILYRTGSLTKPPLQCDKQTRKLPALNYEDFSTIQPLTFFAALETKPEFPNSLLGKLVSDNFESLVRLETRFWETSHSKAWAEMFAEILYVIDSRSGVIYSRSDGCNSFMLQNYLVNFSMLVNPNVTKFYRTVCERKKESSKEVLNVFNYEEFRDHKLITAALSRITNDETQTDEPKMKLPEDNNFDTTLYRSLVKLLYYIYGNFFVDEGMDFTVTGDVVGTGDAREDQFSENLGQLSPLIGKQFIVIKDLEVLLDQIDAFEQPPSVSYALKLVKLAAIILRKEMHASIQHVNSVNEYSLKKLIRFKTTTIWTKSISHEKRLVSLIEDLYLQEEKLHEGSATKLFKVIEALTEQEVSISQNITNWMNKIVHDIPITKEEMDNFLVPLQQQAKNLFLPEAIFLNSFHTGTRKTSPATPKFWDLFNARTLPSHSQTVPYQLEASETVDSTCFDQLLVQLFYYTLYTFPDLCMYAKQNNESLQKELSNVNNRPLLDELLFFVQYTKLNETENSESIFPKTASKPFLLILLQNIHMMFFEKTIKTIIVAQCILDLKSSQFGPFKSREGYFRDRETEFDELLEEMQGGKPVWNREPYKFAKLMFRESLQVLLEGGEKTAEALQQMINFFKVRDDQIQKLIFFSYGKHIDKHLNHNVVMDLSATMDYLRYRYKLSNLVPAPHVAHGASYRGLSMNEYVATKDDAMSPMLEKLRDFLGPVFANRPYDWASKYRYLEVAELKWRALFSPSVGIFTRYQLPVDEEVKRDMVSETMLQTLFHRFDGKNIPTLERGHWLDIYGVNFHSLYPEQFDLLCCFLSSGELNKSLIALTGDTVLGNNSRMSPNPNDIRVDPVMIWSVEGDELFIKQERVIKKLYAKESKPLKLYLTRQSRHNIQIT